MCNSGLPFLLSCLSLPELSVLILSWQTCRLSKEYFLTQLLKAVGSTFNMHLTKLPRQETDPCLQCSKVLSAIFQKTASPGLCADQVVKYFEILSVSKPDARVREIDEHKILTCTLTQLQISSTGPWPELTRPPTVLNHGIQFGPRLLSHPVDFGLS
jgi:hypothetical protein